MLTSAGLCRPRLHRGGFHPGHSRQLHPRDQLSFSYRLSQVCSLILDLFGFYLNAYIISLYWNVLFLMYNLQRLCRWGCDPFFCLQTCWHQMNHPLQICPCCFHTSNVLITLCMQQILRGVTKILNLMNEASEWWYHQPVSQTMIQCSES